MTTSSEAPARWGEGARAMVDEAMERAAAAGREDLVSGLTNQRRRLEAEDFQVLVVGEFGRGKSALVNALVGAPVCGVSAQAATAVPTFVRYGDRPGAHVIPAVPEGQPVQGNRGRPTPVPLSETTLLTLGRQRADLGAYLGVNVDLPRELLKNGLVLVDTAGVGGGFTATAAATTLRVLSAADALLFVTDASADLTGAEVDFLREALALCPVAACVVTKIDLYPAWRKVVALNQKHLREADLDLPVLPVSSLLRELAIDSGDAALAAESGFAVLVKALTDDLRRRQRAARHRAAAFEALGALTMVSMQLAAEHESLMKPVDRERQIGALQASAQPKVTAQQGPANWQDVLADAMRTLRRTLQRDLADRIRGVRDQARAHIAERDPHEQWAEFELWLVRTTNEEVLAHHHRLLGAVAHAAAKVSAHMEVELEGLPFQLGSASPVAVSDEALAGPEHKGGSWIEAALLATRGFTLGGSVMGGTVALATLSKWVIIGGAAALTGPGAAVAAAAIAAGALTGTAVTVRSVRSLRQTELQAFRAQVERSVAGYLDETLRSSSYFDEEMLDTAFVNLRDHFTEVSRRQARSTRSAASAVLKAVDLSASEAEVRRRQVEVELGDVAVLQDALRGVLNEVPERSS